MVATPGLQALQRPAVCFARPSCLRNCPCSCPLNGARGERRSFQALPTARGGFAAVMDPTTASLHDGATKLMDQAAFDPARLRSLGVAAAVQSALHSVGSLLNDVDEEGTSYVCTQYPLASFLDHALRVAEEERLGNPSTPLLVINAISHLRFGSAAAAQPYQALYQRAATALMEVANTAGVYELQNPLVMPAKDVLNYFTAAAGLDFPARVYKGCGFGHLLAHHLKHNNFAPQQLVKLIEAWAILRAGSGYNPCVLNFRLLGEALVAAAPSMTEEELLRTTASCRAFEWPVYNSMAILEGMCAATLARVASGKLPATVGHQVVEAAAGTAAHYRPALRDVLQAKLVSKQLGALDNQPATTKPAAFSGTRHRRGGKARTTDAPANNVVLGPERRVDSVLHGFSAFLPAAMLLVLPALPELPPLAGLVSALLLASLVASYDA